MPNKKPLRIPPHSDEAEESVLGAILIDKDAISAVAPILKPEHFYNDNNGRIYKAALLLYENRRPIDLVTLTLELKKAKDFTKVGGASYLADLTNRVATAANIEEYARIVKKSWVKRELISSSSRISSLAFDEAKEAEEALEEAEKEIFSLSQSGTTRTFIPVKDALIESFDRLDELHKKSSGLRGLPSGFTQLDNLLAGMQDSNLIVLAARPGIGKTALSLNIARHVAVEEKMPVGIFSLEMSQEELVDRLLVRQAQIDSWKLKTGRLDEDDFSRLSDAMGTLAEAPLYIDDTPGISILEMRTKARRLQMERGLKLLVVDYLQLIHGRNIENRVQEVSEISQGLKNLARELKIPVLSISQLSRAVEVRGDQRPRLADLRESGCLGGNTQLIEAQTGRPVTIKQLTKEQKPTTLLTMNSQLRLVEGKATKFFPSGTKKVFRLTLNSGRQIEASENHPFYTINGWKRLDQLTTNDHLATARKIPFPQQTVKINPSRLIVLAHLIGDGCYLTRQPLHYTNKNPKNLQAVSQAAKKGFSIKVRKVKQESWYHLYLSNGYGKNNPIINWLKKIDIFNQRSQEKQLPKFVFQLPKSDLALFLNHLWATDGCLAAKGQKYWSIYYSSTSQQLAWQIQHLLLRFGILSQIKKSQKENYSPNFTVNISGKTEQLKFLKKIGVFGKEDQVQKAIQSLEPLQANPNLDVIPKTVWRLIEAARKERGLTTREFHQKMGWAYSGTQRHHNGISRERLKKINQVLKSNQLDDLANSDVYWDQVKKIEPLGEEIVYDATIEKTHNFLAQDIVVHNSIEQDSDVVMFLYRESDEDRENVILELAKHRNGPVGSIGLRFVSKQISFYPLEKQIPNNA